MKALDLLRRAAGKPPGYVAKRVLREAGRYVRSHQLQRELLDLTPDRLGRRTGVSLPALWRKIGAMGLLYTEEDRAKLRELYGTCYAPAHDALKARVDKILDHEFDILGSGPKQLGKEIDWHLDFKSGHRWDLTPSRKIDYAQLDLPCDVKVPWELSRGQHLVTLGQAWLLDRDERMVREFESQVRSWIRANPPGFGIHWACTMEVGLRAVSWVWALALFDDAPFRDDFPGVMLTALFQHGRWIPENLEESQVNGNHYVADALGMLACGLIFREVAEGREWLELGSKILEQEIRLQVGADGVDIEASIPYHRLVLEIFLTGARFLQFAGRPPSDGYWRKIECMIDFVHAYVTPGGLSPVIGDADDGRVLAFAETPLRDHRYLLSTGCALFGRSNWKRHSLRYWEDSLWFTGPSGLAKYENLSRGAETGPQSFPDSGFYILSSPQQYLFVDAGPVGFKGLGGHGHNDCLSFEWHACGQPLLTDSGLFVYTASPEWRNRFRSTAFHNTIRVDGQEINHFLSPPALWFLGNDAHPLQVCRGCNGRNEVLRAGHTGYQRLKDPVNVFRTWELPRDDLILILRDRIEGTQEHLVEFFFHAAPGAVLDVRDGSSVEFRWEDELRVRVRWTSGPQIDVIEEEGWFAPSYGVKVSRPVFIAAVRARLPLEVVWELTVHDGRR